MESLKITISNPFFYPFIGGIEHRMHTTSKLLVEKGHEVNVLTCRLPNTKEVEESDFGYTIVRVPCKTINVYNPPAIRAKNVLETLNSLKSDIVDYNYRWSPSFDNDLAKYNGKKVFTYHNMWGEGIGIQGIFSEINDYLYKKKLNTYDGIIAISDAVKDCLLSKNIPEEKITVIENALEILPNRPTSDGNYILNIGRMVRTKGLRYLVKAMKEVDYKLIICGKGPESKKIEKLVNKYNLNEKIEIKGWVSDEEKEELMANCRFFVMPSLYESYGLAALEALSYGKPIVCTDVDGLPGNVKNAGLYVHPKNSQDLSEKICLLLNDDELRSTLSKNAISVVTSASWDKVVEKTEEVYKKILNG